MIYVGNSSYLHAKEGCYTCGKGDNLVSTEVQIEGEGILVLCKGCIHDLAIAADMLVAPGEIIADLEATIEAKDEALEELAAAFRSSEDSLNRIRSEWVAAVEHEQVARSSA